MGAARPHSWLGCVQTRSYLRKCPCPQDTRASNKNHYHPTPHFGGTQLAFIIQARHRLCDNSSQTTMAISPSCAIATTSIGLRVNVVFRLDNTLTFFEWEAPATAFDKTLVENLMVVYGARDIFMGLVMCATEPQALGWILIAGSSVTFADNVIC